MLPTITLHHVHYYIRDNQKWKKTFFYLNEAEAFIASLSQTQFIEKNVVETDSPIFTEVTFSNPYRYLSGTYIHLGDYHNARHEYVSSAFTSRELFDVASVVFNQKKMEQKKAADEHYSKQWI